MPRRTLRCLNPSELSISNAVELNKQSLLNEAICGVLGDSIRIPKVLPLDNDAPQVFDAMWDLEPYADDIETLPFIPNADLKDAAGKPFEVQSVINAEVLLSKGDRYAVLLVMMVVWLEPSTIIPF